MRSVHRRKWGEHLEMPVMPSHGQFGDRGDGVRVRVGCLKKPNYLSHRSINISQVWSLYLESAACESPLTVGVYKHS